MNPDPVLTGSSLFSEVGSGSSPNRSRSATLVLPAQKCHRLLGPDSRSRTSGTGQPVQDNRYKTAGTGRPEKDSQPPMQDCLDMTAKWLWALNIGLQVLCAKGWKMRNFAFFSYTLAAFAFLHSFFLSCSSANFLALCSPAKKVRSPTYAGGVIFEYIVGAK
jgi:hypothetical protein